jgi:hypothetical protein
VQLHRDNSKVIGDPAAGPASSSDGTDPLWSVSAAQVPFNLLHAALRTRHSLPLFQPRHSFVASALLVTSSFPVTSFFLATGPFLIATERRQIDLWYGYEALNGFRPAFLWPRACSFSPTLALVARILCLTTLHGRFYTFLTACARNSIVFLRRPFTLLSS